MEASTNVVSRTSGEPTILPSNSDRRRRRRRRSKR